MSEFHRVAVIGLGYIGLPTAAALATRGIKVLGFDVNDSVVDAINRGGAPFAEPDLAVAVSGAVAMGNLSASTDIASADAYIVAVPTPFRDDKSADMSYVRAAVESIAPVLEVGQLVVLESTCPPGSTRQMAQWIADLRGDLKVPLSPTAPGDIYIAHCPERVLPGRIMIEIVTNDRVIGGITESCSKRAASLYSIFCQGEITISDAASAEMAKLVENAFRDVNIAFANELSLICESLKLDVWEVIRIANRHPRVSVLSPGPGVGGHCIAVDPWFLVEAAPELAPLIRMARTVNDSKPAHVVRQVVSHAKRLKGPVVACLGLSFKADVEDIRESPSVEIIGQLASELSESRLLVVEPHIQELPKCLRRENVALAPLDSAIEFADIIVALVGHTEFRSVRRYLLSGKIVVDTCGLWR